MPDNGVADEVVAGQDGDPGTWHRVYTALSRTDERSRRRAFFVGASFALVTFSYVALSVLGDEAISPGAATGVMMMTFSLGELSGRAHQVAISRVLAGAFFVGFFPLAIATWR